MPRHTTGHTIAQKIADGGSEKKRHDKRSRGAAVMHSPSQQHSPADNKQLNDPSDFFALRKIAQSRPEHFARLADKLRNKEINHAPVAVRARLRGLLFQREMRRQYDRSTRQPPATHHRENYGRIAIFRQHSSPVSAQSKMQSALRRVQQLRSDLRALKSETLRLTTVEPTRKKVKATAKIFPLHGKR